MVDANTNEITADVIKSNPYGYTFEEMVKCLGEQETAKFFGKLYKGRPQTQYQTIVVKDIFNGGDTRKYSFELSDKFCIETVCIKRKTGTTVCVSTMVGCPVGCIFCESGSNGFIRNLTPSEIVQQVVLLSEHVNRIVFMGMGEPLFNYDALIKAIHILRDRRGLNFPTDGITISTVGPLLQLKKLREEHIKIQLTLSLHTTNQKTRDMLMPHMRGNNINKIVEAVLSYSERHNRKITIAYLLIPGLNDTASDVRQLGRWFREKNVMINLLQYNETKCCTLKRPTKQQMVAFKLRLEEAGLEVKLRESRGNNIKAACGQLVSLRNKERQHQGFMPSNNKGQTKMGRDRESTSKKHGAKIGDVKRATTSQQKKLGKKKQINSYTGVHGNKKK